MLDPVAIPGDLESRSSVNKDSVAFGGNNGVRESGLNNGVSEGEIKGRDSTTGGCTGGSSAVAKDLETTFQLDEDAVQSMKSNDPVILRTKRRRSRRKRLSESLSQPRFSDNYRLTGDAFLGCGSYGSVYTCSSLKNSYSANADRHGQSSEAVKQPKSKGGRISQKIRDRTNSHSVHLCGDEGGDDQDNEEYFAVKRIEKRGHSRARVFSEMEIMHQCRDHDNIVQLIDFYEEELEFFLVYEKMNGGTLVDHLSHGPVGERDASLVTRDVASALSFLHSKGIAHRDLKPANILCVYPNCIAPVKLCDFDLASAPWIRPDKPGDSLANYSVDSVDLVSPVGSAEYMAPEVVNVFLGSSSACAYDKRCDLWSLGVILYLMLCGYPPFVGRCGYECGWEQGHSCAECQSMLMEAIQSGVLLFPSPEWDMVSGEAVELVCSLLERDASLRISPEAVLDHEWMYSVRAVASDPIPLLTKQNSVVTSGRHSQRSDPRNQRGIEVNTRHEVENNSEVVSYSPPDTEEERHRLGTEDSGFGGDTVVTSVVGMLLDAANEDENDDHHSRHIEHSDKNGTLVGSSNGETSSNGPGRGGRKENRLASEMSDQQMFDLSDDESLFSSGYGMSLDMPSSELVVGLIEFESNNNNNNMTSAKRQARLEKTPSSETDFGFESVNKSEIENEMRKAEASSEPTKGTLLKSLGLRRSKDLEVSRNFADSVTSLSDQMANGCYVSNGNAERAEATGKMKPKSGQAAFGDSAWSEDDYN